MKLNIIKDGPTIPDALGISEDFIDTIARPFMTELFNPKTEDESNQRIIEALAEVVEKCDTIEQVVYLTYIMARRAALREYQEGGL